MSLKLTLSERLWGSAASKRWLWLAIMAVLFGMLGSRTPWTMEGRWYDIVDHMLKTGDYLHPYLNGKEYYDKPLMTYWLIVVFAKLFHGLNTWTLRLPSAIAGCVTLWGTYRLGAVLRSETVGLKAAWILLTAFGFGFWARVGSADIFNMMGIVIALLWYVKHRDNARFNDYSVFMLIVVFTSLCKGLVAPVCIVLLMLPDLLQQGSWRRHLNMKLLLAIMLALGLYALPFVLSIHYNSGGYQESGFVEVFRENILRFFQPFDHMGPWHTYFMYVPYYFFPWIVFLIPALVDAIKSRSAQMWESRWLLWMVVLIFLFFSLSQSRRSYYILPILPFAALITADWQMSDKLEKISGWVAIVMLIALLGYYWVGIPIYYQQ